MPYLGFIKTTNIVLHADQTRQPNQVLQKHIWWVIMKCICTRTLKFIVFMSIFISPGVKHHCLFVVLRPTREYFALIWRRHQLRRRTAKLVLYHIHDRHRRLFHKIFSMQLIITQALVSQIFSIPLVITQILLLLVSKKCALGSITRHTSCNTGPWILPSL